MSIEEKAKAYDEALERAKELIAKWTGKNKDFYIEDYSYIFPELRESEDEKIRKWLVDYFSSIKETVWIHRDITCEQILDWLKKQKGNQYFVGYAKGYSEGQLNPKQKEQKFAEPSDEELVKHPPITYTYPSDASRDVRLKMALLALLNSDLVKVVGNKFTKQDLIDWVGRIPTDKPAEWSEEDELMRTAIIQTLERFGGRGTTGMQIDWLKDLRPSWKPSELEKGALRTAIHILTDERSFPKAAAQLQNILDAFEKS